GDEGRELQGIEEAPPLGLQPYEGEEQKRVEDQVGRECQEGEGKVGDEMPSSHSSRACNGMRASTSASAAMTPSIVPIVDRLTVALAKFMVRTPDRPGGSLTRTRQPALD